MSNIDSSFSDPNSIRDLLAINALHHVLSTIDKNTPIETQAELVRKMPEGRLFDVCPLDTMPEFQANFLSNLYKSSIQGKLFAAFPSYEDKMAHALSAQAIASIPDASTLDFDKNYRRRSNEYCSKIIESFFNKSEINLTITPQETAIKTILLYKSFKEYTAGIGNPSNSAAIIAGAVDKFLPDIIELKKAGLSDLLYTFFFDKYDELYITLSLTSVMYKTSTPGLSDPASKTKLNEAYEKLKAAPGLPENYLSSIKDVMNTAEEVSKKNSNPGCLGILVLLLTLIPTLTYAASRLLS